MIDRNIFSPQELESIKESEILIENKIDEANRALQVCGTLKRINQLNLKLQSLLRIKSSLEHEEKVKMQGQEIDQELCLETRMRRLQL